MPYVLYGIILIALIILVRNIRIVPQAQAYVITRLGAYKTTWGVGLHLKIPFIESVAKRLSLKEQVADFPPQPVITKDNVTMQIDTVVYYQITDPKLYTYGIEQPILAIENLSATTLRNLIGDLELDQCLTSRDIVNTKMRQILDEATDPWGIKVNRVELKNILPPKEIQSAMEKQMKAERERREAILRAEGEKRSAILTAEGEKESAILRADAKKQEQILEAQGRAEAILTVQRATAEGIRLINESMPSDAVIKLKSLEAFAAAADGRATKIIIPSEIQGVAALAAGLVESVKGEAPTPRRARRGVFGKKERTHMKFPFLKKNKPAPTPEAPAAPRAPFPFAAPAQDEPVPAIHIDARVLAFLRKYDAAPGQLDTQALTDAMLAAMQRGLRGEAGGLPMLPAYLAPHGHITAPKDKRVAVIDAGGTNFRVATVHYEFGQPILEDERTLPMPGSEQDADWMDFIRLAADALEPLLDRVTQIGVCFSYPAENTPELDAKVLGMTKEVQLTGWEDHLVGADLAEELERRGCTKLPIVVINDTPATYLSGSTTIANNYANGFAGLVNGTGTNTCCLLPVRAIEKLGRDADGEMLVNLESGSFTDVPQSAFDKALDAASAAPGAYRFEKMTSGRYLGKLSRLALIAAAKDGLFAPETADKLRTLDVLTAADADAFGADPDCGAIAALSDAADADRKTAAMVIQSVFGRAAKAIVANIAAIVFLTDGAKNRYRPMVVAVDGALFRYSTLLRPAVSKELEAFLVQKHQRHCVCKPVPNASAIGTAAASLLQG